MRFTHTVLTLLTLGLALSASAAPITWTLSGVTLGGGITASGSFTFNADAGTACSGATTPCGTYSNVDITTTAGGGFGAATFLYTCGQDVATCNGFSPDSTEALFLTSNASNQIGLLGIDFFFTALGVKPPAGLTDAGGTIDVSNSSLSVGAVIEGLCSNPACSPLGSQEFSTAGLVSSPEPSSALLLGASLAVLGLARFYRSRRA